MDSVSTLCSVVKGDSPISIWWTLSDSDLGIERNLSSNDGLMITRNGQKLSVINIEQVQARHRGNYTCFAKNKAGITQHSAYLSVNGDLQICFSIIQFDKIFWFNWFCNLFPFKVLPQIAPFDFGDEPINIYESVSAMCSVNKGDLPIKIWWTFFDAHFGIDRNLSSNDGIVITKTGQKATVLTIESAQPRHRQNYTCHAQNKGGIAEQSAYLSINGE